MGPKHKVSKVRHTMIRAGRNVGHFNSDLIFIKDVPTIVIEWQTRPGGDVPAVTVSLDPAHLHPLGWKSADYVYELPVEDPRQLD